MMNSSISRRKAIRNMLVLAPAGYVNISGLTPAVKQPALPAPLVAGAGKHLVYTHLIDPREHPDDVRRFVRPPDWKLFGNRPHFATLRGFGIQEGQIVRFKEDLDLYTHTYGLGDVIWPFHNILEAENLSEVIEEFKKRDLFMFDIWGYVPGSGPGTWEEFTMPPEVADMLCSRLGDHWLGMDNGEQDGRYIGGYASQVFPVSADRKQRYFHFQNHFERMADDLGNRLSTLVSLNYGHYFLKEGIYTLIGAETAQGLPNSQIYYSFIRGAGKQYGVPWFGNASVYNRWGNKTYNREGDTFGASKGSSLSLMKRLIYSHILYNSVIVGFEGEWLYEAKIGRGAGAKGQEDALTPIGRIQQSAVKWVEEHGMPGVMHTPVALMLDFFAGWTFPRHLYSSEVYKVWGVLPYGAGDHLTDEILRMLYPGYEDSSFYHDERGFLSPSPFGDMADCLLSDAEEWLLRRYPVLVIAGDLSGGLEMVDKLSNYVAGGGHLVISSANLVKFSAGIADVSATGPARRHEAGASISLKNGKIREEDAFDYYQLSYPSDTVILARSNNVMLAVQRKSGKGTITVLASAYGIGADSKLPGHGSIENAEDKPLPSPYPMNKHVGMLLKEIFQGQMLFSSGNPELSLITCCGENGRYTVAITNNTWKEQPFKIGSYIGSINSIQEMPIDQADRQAVGYTPEKIDKGTLGINQDYTIAGGDIRIFSVAVSQGEVDEIPHEVPPSRPVNRFLPLKKVEMVKESILERPTFFTHFDGVVLDWKYLLKRERSALKEEAGWISRQRLRIIVDLSSGIDLYPDLRLIDNIHTDFLKSMEKIEDVMDKMRILHAKDLVLSLHRVPENNFSEAQTNHSFAWTLTRICKYARSLDIQVHLRIGLDKPPYGVREAIGFIGGIGASNLKLAPMVASMQAKGENMQGLPDLMRGKTGLWLLGAAEKGIDGKSWNLNKPLSASGHSGELFGIINLLPDVPVVLDAVYSSCDEEYGDSLILTKALRK